jgi:DNA-directed RNA polymerase specialized sigma24 family protein
VDDEKGTFSDLIEHYQKKFFQDAISILGDKDGALDITQEFFIKTFR